ncbi:coiled-coil domain-containing protein 14 isoform X3 [Scyliorhinus torazame]|uniref:coiled-coil domain-containing protein 14 isoform X3 n=1 Tax=Scyliorhinus torazame TaxID=75743 RepID=UPI003B5B1C49
MPVGRNRETTVRMKTARASKALSSGRLVGSSKQWNGKKRIAGAKASINSVESGYSLYSTDSEDQVTNIHNGLDRCAALLQDILKNETTDPKVSPLKSRKTNVTKEKVTSSKGENTKKEVKKNGSISCATHVQKETVSTPKFKVTPDAAEVGVNNTVHVSTMPQFTIPSSQQTPVINQCLSDHVQTQMGLLNGHAPGSASNGIPAQSYYTILDSGSQAVPTFNCRLPTSTPAMSPKSAEHPFVIQGQSMSTDLYNQPVLHGGLNLLPTYSATATIAPPVQPVMTFAPSAAPPAVIAHPLTQLVCDNGGSHSLINHGLQQLKEQELLKCIQCHITQMQQHGEESQQEAWNAQIQSQGTDKSDTEQSDGTTSEEDHVNLVDITPVRDTSCQTSFDKYTKAKKQSPDKTAKKVKTIRYLLSELKAMIADQDDSEVHRLIMELEDSISLLPTVIGSINVQAEIAMNLQPLRSENAQLRRRLRIVNQQLRERERAEKDSRSVECNFEVFSLQSMNMTLQAQLRESLKGLETLQKKNEELLNVIDKQREGNKQLLRLVQGKEKDLFQKSQQCEMDTTRVKMVGEALTKMRNIQLKLEASEKENQILEITLRQRDAEVNRLRELTRNLQSSMARLLSDLSIDCMKAKPTSRLTRNLLQEYEKQLQDDSGLSSVTVYLKNLDTNSEYDAPALSSCKISESLTIPVQPYFTTATTESNGLSAKSSPTSFSRYSAQSENHTARGYEDSNLDETTYIPLVGNASKQENEPEERKKFVQLNTGSNKLHYNNESSSNGMVVMTCIPDGLEKTETALPEEISNTHKLKEKTAVNDYSSRMAVAENNQIHLRSLDITGLDFPGNITAFPKSNLNLCTSLSHQRNRTQLHKDKISLVDSSFSSTDYRSIKSGWSMSSISSFNSHDEQDFRNSLATLDANIARLQKSLHADLEINRSQNI